MGTKDTSKMGYTVLHGVSQSVPTAADLPTKGNMASELLTEDLLGKWVYDLHEQEWKPMEYIPFKWSFEDNGGDPGWYDLGVTIPKNTIIWDGLFHVIDAVLPTNAQFLIKAESDVGETGDIQDTVAASSGGTAGLHDITPDGTAANAILMTSDKNIKFQITEAATITAGTIVGFLRCFRSFEAADWESSSSSSSSASSTSSVSTSSSSSASTSSGSVSSTSESSTSSNSSSSSSATSSASSVTSSSSASSATSSSSSSSSSASGSSSSG